MVTWSHEKRRNAGKSDTSTTEAEKEQLRLDWGKITDNVAEDFIRFCNNPRLSVSTITADMATFKAGQEAACQYFLDQIEKGKTNERQTTKRTKDI